MLDDTLGSMKWHKGDLHWTRNDPASEDFKQASLDKMTVVS